MKKILTIFFLSISLMGYAQQNNGAIKTKSGFLLYFNLDQNSHTLDLEGEIDLSNFPFINQNSTWFQFLTNNKSTFENDSKSILENYMIWEFDYIQKQFGRELILKNTSIELNGLTANFWHYQNPMMSNDKISNPIKSTYFLDFTKNDLMYRFIYASTTGDNSEANTILTSIAKNLRFYDNDIDLKRLQLNISKGINYY